MYPDLVFEIFNGWHMAAGCLLISLILLYKAQGARYKATNMRIKAVNWFLLAAAFIATEVLAMPGIVERSWLRIAFALLVIGEIAYHGDCVVDMAESLWKKVRPENDDTE